MPAAAVIPAPVAYIKVVAVKKLVVGSEVPAGGPRFRENETGVLLPAIRLLTRRLAAGALD